MREPRQVHPVDERVGKMANVATMTIRYGGCLDGYEEVKTFGSQRERRHYLATQSPVYIGGKWHVLCYKTGNRNSLFYVPSGLTPKLLGTFILD